MRRKRRRKRWWWWWQKKRKRKRRRWRERRNSLQWLTSTEGMPVDEHSWYVADNE